MQDVLENFPDRVKKICHKINEDNFDVEAWSLLAREAQLAVEMKNARIIYEHIVAQFPSTGRYWKLYIEHEVSFSCLRK